MSNRKNELLKEYAEKDIHSFTQIDGWTGDIGDSIIKLDSDNDWLSWGNTEELRRSPKELAVRVQIHEGTTKKDTIRLLLKILTTISKDDFIIRESDDIDIGEEIARVVSLHVLNKDVKRGE